MIRTIFKIFATALVLFGPPAIAQSPAELRPPSLEEAEIAFLIDVTNGQVLHERNADRRFVPASITKVMTLYTAFEKIDQGELVQNQYFMMRPDSWREWSNKGSRMFLPRDARASVDELLMGIATVSANDGAIMLAEGASGSVEAWLDAMNANARKLGMADSHFGTPNGWMDEGGTFTTARDLAKLARALAFDHPRKYARYFGRREFTFNDITQRNRDPITGRVRGADGLKTGFTNEAGFGFLGSAYRNGRRLVIVVAGSDRSRERDRAARRYLEWGFSNFGKKDLFAANQVVGHAMVQGGDARSVALISNNAISVNVPKRGTDELTIRIEYEGPIPAPIREGQRVATMHIDIEGMEPARIPLYAVAPVEEANFLERTLNGVIGWFV